MQEKPFSENIKPQALLIYKAVSREAYNDKWNYEYRTEGAVRSSPFLG